MKRKIVVGFFVLMLLVGIGIMLYPTISSMVNAKSQSDVIASYEAQVSGLSEEEIEEYLAAADEYNEWLRSALIVLKDPFEEEAQEAAVANDYYDILNVDDDGVMGYISIDIEERDISISLPIYHGTSTSALALGAGHLEGTSLPVGGESTHSVISAHTGLVGATMFNDLAKLQGEDEFTDEDVFSITVLGRTLTYQIYSVEVIEPDDTSSLLISDGEDLVTLITCTPYGINTHRLLVHGKRVIETESEAEGTTESADEDVTPTLTTLLNTLLTTLFASAYVYREYLAVGAGIVILALIMLILMIRRRRKKRREKIKKLTDQIKKQENDSSK